MREWEWEWEGMGINILLLERMFLYTTIGMGWEWEYGHLNEREWDRKSHSLTSLTKNDSETVKTIQVNYLKCVVFFHYFA